MRKWWMTFFLAGLLIKLPAQFFPPGIPQVTVNIQPGEMLCDHLFLATVRFVQPSQLPSTAMILDRHGDLEWYFQTAENIFDFRPQDGGFLSMFVEPEFYLIDSALNISAQVSCVGKSIDFHALHVTHSGRIFALCSTDSVMDLSSILTAGGLPGSTACNVLTQTVQELNFNGALIKEWEPWPWYSIGDADSVFFTQPTSYDFTHTNSIDFDGQHILLSHRSLHEATLIDWNTGVVLKKIGGKNSDYVMSDSARFTGQHTARFVGGGKISVYDNGAQSNPPLSRGLVLQLNDSDLTAQIAAQYPNPNIVSNSMGSFQVLLGSALVNHGRFSPNTGPNIEYFSENGTRLADITLEPTYFTYAASCGGMPFEIRRPEILCSAVSSDSILLTANETSNSYLWSTGETTNSIWITTPGRYQVFVPRGIGSAGSIALEIMDLSNGCPVVGVEPVQPANKPAPKLTGRFDLLGRPVQDQARGQVVVERYSDGSHRKIWQE